MSFALDVDEISKHSKSPDGIRGLSCIPGHRECIYELWCTMKQARTSSRPFAGVDMRVFNTSRVVSCVGRVTTAIGSFDIREQLGCFLN